MNLLLWNHEEDDRSRDSYVMKKVLDELEREKVDREERLKSLIYGELILVGINKGHLKSHRK